MVVDDRLYLNTGGHLVRSDCKFKQIASIPLSLMTNNSLLIIMC